MEANEFNVLEMMAKVFKGTDWEPVIMARMEEIENEAK